MLYITENTVTNIRAKVTYKILTVFIFKIYWLVVFVFVFPFKAENMGIRSS